MILAADVGGTNTRLALYAPGASPRDPVREHRYPSREYASLEAIILEFLGGDREALDAAAVGVAGPVVENRTEATNLPWLFDGQALSRRFGGPVRLLNDLEATAWGVALLGARDLRTLQPGRQSAGNRALIAAGTGLGESLIVWDGAAHRPTASEGGHADFASRDPLEDELNVWLRAKYGRVSYERVLSGPGLADLYRFFSETGRGHEPDEVAQRFASHADPAQVVTQTALDGTCERARLTVERWITIYGAEAGNLALKGFAVNGVFVGGGIAPRMPDAFAAGGFVEAFCSKGRLSAVAANIPVALILDDRTGLHGAASRALALAQTTRGAAAT